MKYLNKRTGVVVDVPCPLQGEDWEEVTEAKKAEPKPAAVKAEPAEKPAKAAKAEPAKKTPAKAAAKKTAKKG